MRQQTITELAFHLVHLADREGQLPVITHDRRLVLRPVFYRQLAKDLLAIAGRPLRYEFLVKDAGFRNLGVNWAVSRYMTQLIRLWASPASPVASTGVGGTKIDVAVQRRMVVSRPAGLHRPLAIGVCIVDRPLPPWATKVVLTEQPSHIDQFQLVAA
jgi:hypothetical protein